MINAKKWSNHYLSHCPIQGPQALASTIPPMSLSGLSMPSRSMVALICSEPGVIVKVDLCMCNVTAVHRQLH